MNVAKGPGVWALLSFWEDKSTESKVFTRGLVSSRQWLLALEVASSHRVTKIRLMRSCRVIATSVPCLHRQFPLIPAPWIPLKLIQVFLHLGPFISKYLSCCSKIWDSTHLLRFASIHMKANLLLSMSRMQWRWLAGLLHLLEHLHQDAGFQRLLRPRPADACTVVVIPLHLSWHVH